MEYEIHWRDGFFEIRTRGVAEVSAFCQYLEELLLHPEWQPNTPLLVDYRDLDSAELGPSEILTIAQHSKRHAKQVGRNKLSILVSDDLTFGLARMWKAYADNTREVNVRYFRERDEAVEWLLCDS